MDLRPRPSELLARARSDLRVGLPVVLAGHGERVLIAAAETLTPDRLGALADLGAVHLAITARRAETLKARAYDHDLARLPLPEGCDAAWVHAIADPEGDLRNPMKGPLFARREGDAALSRLGIALAKSAELLPSVLVVPAPAVTPELTELQANTAGPLLTDAQHFAPLVSARLPVRTSAHGRLHVFRPNAGGVEHYAFEVGRPDRAAPVLARLHSACFTGDVLGSLKCDCGPQLQAALAQMGREGAGVLLYLNQEGRGIGLANKMRAYSLQDQGFDTVEANHRLGFEDDERDFRIGSDILKSMGFNAVRLLTNNPAKIDMMRAQGVEVTERVALRVGETDENAAYLATKIAKSGHLP
ncbi:GTP cyclohydrolase II [Primorskyibacter sp. S187A]|uniref:GTP cyclohydrolase II n=1 Tax=Primorskyibacter sp. S187A TaxID=3415130 RepID=UPI003C7D7D20